MVRRKKTAAERWMAAKPTPEEIEAEKAASDKTRVGPDYKFPTMERFRLSPRTDKELDMLAHDLLLYAQQPETISFDGFIDVSGIHNARLYEYARKHHGLSEAIIAARQLIGQRRESGALHNKLNAAVHLSTYPMFNPEYRSLRKEMTQKDSGGGALRINVVMEKYPEVETVPVKEEDDEQPYSQAPQADT